MDLIKDEIRTFNKGLTPLGNLYWILSPENRARQTAGSIAIAFATPEEASTAIRNRLYIAGISVRVLGASAMATYHTTAIERLGASYAANHIRRNSIYALYVMRRLAVPTLS
ncbi:hypothetical protein LSUB1_G008744 [Lachnellula subtilissima]|uniref:Uncharacterized protein n=1 Tax=Lachnellula subtilissima TaxID=602034 RepID=A0A8H8U2L3_9HELO|nr:hypothetical protein LSUB1_G008744 [Lachnellula subtilissima]